MDIVSEVKADSVVSVPKAFRGLCLKSWLLLLPFLSTPIGHLLVVAVSVSCEFGTLVSVGRRAVWSGKPRGCWLHVWGGVMEA